MEERTVSNPHIYSYTMTQDQFFAIFKEASKKWQHGSAGLDLYLWDALQPHLQYGPSSGAQLAWEGVLDEIEDYLEQRQDITDNADGSQRANEAMSLLSDLRWWRPKPSTATSQPQEGA